MPRFKIGDEVRVREGHSPRNAFPETAIFRGDSEDKNRKGMSLVALERSDGVEGDAQNDWWNFKKEDLKDLELINKLEGFLEEICGSFPMCATSYTNYDPPRKMKNTMKNIRDFVKNARLTSDERLLREMGLKDDCGNYTEEAHDLVADKLARDNEKYLIEKARAFKADRDKKTKDEK